MKTLSGLIEEISELSQNDPAEENDEELINKIEYVIDHGGDGALLELNNRIINSKNPVEIVFISRSCARKFGVGFLRDLVISRAVLKQIGCSDPCLEEIFEGLVINNPGDAFSVADSLSRSSVDFERELSVEILERLGNEQAFLRILELCHDVAIDVSKRSIIAISVFPESFQPIKNLVELADSNIAKNDMSRIAAIIYSIVQTNSTDAFDALQTIRAKNRFNITEIDDAVKIISFRKAGKIKKMILAFVHLLRNPI